jgi:hypothetical protein
VERPHHRASTKTVPLSAANNKADRDGGLQMRQVQAARNAAATRTQLSVDHDRDRLRTEGQRDAAYEEMTGQDRPSSEARRKLIRRFIMLKGRRGL